jgi:hypothetical protein
LGRSLGAPSGGSRCSPTPAGGHRIAVAGTSLPGAVAGRAEAQVRATRYSARTEIAAPSLWALILKVIAFATRRTGAPSAAPFRLENWGVGASFFGSGSR